MFTQSGCNCHYDKAGYLMFVLARFWGDFLMLNFMMNLRLMFVCFVNHFTGEEDVFSCKTFQTFSYSSYLFTTLVFTFCLLLVQLNQMPG